MVNCLEVKESPPLVFDPGREVEGAAVDQSVVRGERGHHLDKVVLVVEGENGLPRCWLCFGPLSIYK